MSMKERVKEIKKEMSSGKREYKEVTIGSMEEQGFMPLDVAGENSKNIPSTFNSWDFILKFMNAALVKGADFTRDTPFREYFTEFGSVLEKGFLLKSSKNSSSPNSESDPEAS